MSQTNRLIDTRCQFKIAIEFQCQIQSMNHQSSSTSANNAAASIASFSFSLSLSDRGEAGNCPEPNLAAETVAADGNCPDIDAYDAGPPDTDAAAPSSLAVKFVDDVGGAATGVNVAGAADHGNAGPLGFLIALNSNTVKRVSNFDADNSSIGSSDGFLQTHTRANESKNQNEKVSG